MLLCHFLLTVNTFLHCIIFFSNHQKCHFPYSRVLRITETDTLAPVLMSDRKHQMGF